MEDIFKTVRIKFHDREEFNRATELNSFSDDIGYSDMVFCYAEENKFFMERFAGYLSTKEFKSFSVDTE